MNWMCCTSDSRLCKPICLWIEKNAFVHHFNWHLKIRLRPKTLKILTIMLLSNAQKSSLYYAFTIIIMLSKILLHYNIFLFTDCSIRVHVSECSIRVSRSGCCKACLTPQESMYSADLHAFTFKLGALRQNL